MGWCCGCGDSDTPDKGGDTCRQTEIRFRSGEVGGRQAVKALPPEIRLDPIRDTLQYPMRPPALHQLPAVDV
ncbi:hypothetical protein PR202_ga29255 [Eleusine coracana subsp. coracana]|uniref:Uncharacterized protein n=1 Tax=Eleusine coracana subsp. coracana TaxID=191504 RepID=A0AAV5DL63_ELECO|nr:hypothetical protein PR202_ga29255 [Eleusine coracana subsp. coracana]